MRIKGQRSRGDEEQDQFIFAGSVFEAEGKYHIFYTGFNRDYPKLGKASQVLMHAESDDLLNWTKTQDKLTFTPQEGYDPDDWRDPFVIWNEEKQEGRPQGTTDRTYRKVYLQRPEKLEI